MKNAKRNLISVCSVFLGIELALGMLVQTTSGALNVAVSFGAIVLACLFSVVLYTKTSEYALTQIALFFTVIADLFLVVLGSHREIAMVSFSFTQICYFLRIYLAQNSKKERIVHLSVRGAFTIFALILTVVVLKEKTDFLSLVSLFYYANLLMNVIYSYMELKKSILFPIGLTLFALCDLFIGFGALDELYMSIEKGTLLYWLSNPGFNLAWLFYVPSQALLSLSLAKTKLKNLE